MVDQLFGSKTRVKLLKFFFTNQDEEFFVRELTRLLDEQINSIRRELINLSEAGVVKSDEKENKVYYSLNKEGELYDGLNRILGPKEEATPETTKTVKAGKAVADPNKQKKGIVVKDAKLKLLKDELSEVDGVKYISVSGVLLKNATKGVDLLVVGEVKEDLLAEKIKKVETKLNKALNYVVMTGSSYKYRMQINDRFLMSFLQGKNEVLLDELNN